MNCLQFPNISDREQLAAPRALSAANNKLDAS